MNAPHSVLDAPRGHAWRKNRWVIALTLTLPEAS